MPQEFVSDRDTRSFASEFLAQGFVPIPLPMGQKRPQLKDWPSLRRETFELDRHFPRGVTCNIGLLLGQPSGGLIDIDLDSPEAVTAASFHLPKTGMMSGRASGSPSHYWYRVDESPTLATQSFSDPVARKGDRHRPLLLELRSTGGQSVVPPSVLPARDAEQASDPVVWFGKGSPAPLSIRELKHAVGAVAGAALLGRHWPTGQRHKASLALAGALLRAGWTVAQVNSLITAVCAVAGDEEIEDRLRAVADTAEALQRNEPVCGWPSLISLLGHSGKRLVDAITRWLVLTPSNVAKASKRGPRYIPLAPYVPFPTDCLPEPWQTFVRQGAMALRCDEALVALPVIAALSGAIGNTRRLHLGGEWFEPCVFWTCVVAESGGLKSPAADLVMGLVKSRQRRLVTEFKEALHQYRRDMVEYKKRGAEEDGDPGEPPRAPTLQRVLVSDVTIEKLAEVLDENERGILTYRDELAGWLGSFARYKGKAGGSDEPIWLSMHRADALIYDRKTGNKPSVFVPYAAVSVAGGIQPGILQKLMSIDFMASGLTARILFAMPPRTPKTWSDDTITPEIKAAAEASLQSLYSLACEKDAEGEYQPVILKLDGAARQRIKRFVNEWGLRQSRADGDRASALSKLEAVPGRFAILHHVVTRAGTFEDTDPVPLTSLEAGIRLAEWFANEAERVYSMLGESAEEQELRRLVEVVTRLAAPNAGLVTVKMLQRSNQRRYRTREQAMLDLEKLAGMGLGEWKDDSHSGQRGRPSPTFELRLPEAEGGDGFDDDDEEDGPCDDYQEGPDDRSPDGNGDSNGSDFPYESYDRTIEKDGRFSSFSSHVTHDPSMPTSVPSSAALPTSEKSPDMCDDHQAVASCRLHAENGHANGSDHEGGTYSVNANEPEGFSSFSSHVTHDGSKTNEAHIPSFEPVRRVTSQGCADDASRSHEEPAHPHVPMTSTAGFEAGRLNSTSDSRMMCDENDENTRSPSLTSEESYRNSPAETVEDRIHASDINALQKGNSSDIDPHSTPHLSPSRASRQAPEKATRRGASSGLSSHSPEDFRHTPSLKVITTVDRLPDIVDAIADDGGCVGLDTETTGLDPIRDRVRLLQVATGRGTFLIDLFTLPHPDRDLSDLFEILRQVEVAGHNLQFDLRFLAPLGFTPGRVFDTMLASQILHAGERHGNARLGYGLDDVARRELGVVLRKDAQRSDWSRPILSVEQIAYARADVEVLRPLTESLKTKLAAAGLESMTLWEMRSLPGIAWAGPMCVDARAWLDLATAAERDRDRLLAEMETLVPNPASMFGTRNWNSPDDVKTAFATLGITLSSTDDDTLSALEHPLARCLRDYRSAVKRTGTYGRAWLAEHAPDGWVRPSWVTLGAESGRMSCKEPNLQQVPRGSDYRRCFTARPGHVLIKADYSQIELRIAAKVAEDRVMIDAYRNGDDLHTLTASKILGKPVSEVTKADRQLAKAINFGLLYGMGWKSLGAYARANYGVALTADQARSYRDAFFETYPGIRDWHQSVRRRLDRLCREQPDAFHEIRTLGNRVRKLPVARRNGQGHAFANITEALNSPVQGTGADGLKAAIAMLWERRDECPGGRPVLFCHDEIVVEAPVGVVEVAAAWLKKVMLDGMSPLVAPIPVDVEVSTGTTWGG